VTTVTALVIQPDGRGEVQNIGTDLDSIKEVVGGWLEAIYPSTDQYGNWHAYIDEEGKLKGLPINKVGTAFAHSIGWDRGIDVLVGPVIFFGYAPDGEEGSIPPQVMEAARWTWGHDDDN
jgi:hypothetical protein